jgi:hypothetical protein
MVSGSVFTGIIVTLISVSVAAVINVSLGKLFPPLSGWLTWKCSGNVTIFARVKLLPIDAKKCSQLDDMTDGGGCVRSQHGPALVHITRVLFAM